MRKIVSAIAATFVAWLAAIVVVAILPLGGPLGVLAVALSNGSSYAANATYGALHGLLTLVLTIIVALPLYRRLIAVRLGKRQADPIPLPAMSHGPSLTPTFGGGHGPTPQAGDQKAREAAIAAQVGATAKEEVPATQAAQLATTSRATPKVATVRGRLLPALGFDGVTNNARKLALLVSVAVGAIVALYGVAQAWVGTYTQWTPVVMGHCVQTPGYVPSIPPGPMASSFADLFLEDPVPVTTCYPGVPSSSATITGHFEFGQFHPSYILWAGLAVVVTFLVIAALRWAWRSYR